MKHFCHLLFLLPVLFLLSACQHTQHGAAGASGTGGDGDKALATELGKALARSDEYLLIGVYVPEDSVTITRYDGSVLLNIPISALKAVKGQPESTGPVSSIWRELALANAPHEYDFVVNEPFREKVVSLFTARGISFEEQTDSVPLPNGAVLTPKLLCADVTQLSPAELSALIAAVFDYHFHTNFQVGIGKL